jgi:hypothetical protein
MINGPISGRHAGITGNISRNGLLVELPGVSTADSLPAVGEPIEAELDLPLHHSVPRKCLRCCGTVRRILASPDCPPQIAIQVHLMDFCTPSNGAKTVGGGAGDTLVRII